MKTPLPLLLVLTLGTLLPPSQARAQDVERSELPPLPGTAPADLTPAPPARPQAQPPGLAPLPTAEVAGSPLPHDLWNGVEAQELKRLIAGATLPSHSPALAGLIARALATGDESDPEHVLIRADALNRAGRVVEAADLLSRAVPDSDPAILARYALALLALGRKDEACDLRLAVPAQKPADPARREALLVPAYCDAARGDGAGAKLALQLAREAGAETSLAAAALGSRKPSLPKNVRVIDYLFLTLGEQRPSGEVSARAKPELLFLLAHDDAAPAELRIAAAERAASLNVVSGEELARAYREGAKALAKSAKSAPALRARLFASFENAPSSKIRGESIAALLGSARDQGIEIPVAQALARASAGLMGDPQAASFAETGVRVAALAGDEQSAWAWIDAGGERLRSWQLLLVASDPQGPRAEGALAEGVQLALQGSVAPPLLHRLVTVLDALDYEVPIPLWNEASKTPQPNDGYLPETGALSSLKEAADKGEVGRTVLLAAAALGPDGAKGAHLIALGDSIRALKRVGLEAEARRFGFEALYALWPSRGRA